MADKNKKGEKEKEGSGVAGAVEKNLINYLKKEGGIAPIAPLQNQTKEGGTLRSKLGGSSENRG